MARWELLARDADRRVLGYVTAGAFELTVRYNEVGSWQLTAPVESLPQGWPAEGAGLIFLRDGQVFASGNIDADHYQWSATEGRGVYTVNGDTDLGRIAYRIVYPVPESDWEGNGSGTSTRTHFTVTGQASAVVRNFVIWNAGTLARPSRQVPGLYLSAGAAFGPTISVSERFTPILEAMRKAAIAGGGIAFDVRDDLQGGLEVLTWQPEDRSQDAVFGVEAGNLLELSVQRVAPVATTALVAGPGEGTDRFTVEVVDGTANPDWGRRELFLDQRQIQGPKPAEGGEPARTPADVIAELELSGDEALAENRMQTAVSAKVIDTPTVQFGREYGLGDKVMVLTPHGPLVDLVREVQITVDEAGVEEVVTTIGTASPATDDPLIDQVTRLARRINVLERGQ